jgi:hypothetical protein
MTRDSLHAWIPAVGMALVLMVAPAALAQEPKS